MGTDTARPGYHHGDLRATLVLTALEMLEGGETFSLRAIARRTRPGCGCPNSPTPTTCFPNAVSSRRS